jgi:hypothetical protein
VTEIPVHGPFDLAQSTRFLEGFAPAELPVPPVEEERLRGLAEAALDGRPYGGRWRAAREERTARSR